MNKYEGKESIKSSTIQYLTYITSSDSNLKNFEIRYEDENIWLSQKMISELYGVNVNTINGHIKKYLVMES